MIALDVAKRLKKKFGDATSEPREFRGEVSVEVPRERILEVCRFLKTNHDLAFDYLVDISGVDNFGDEPRFEVVYHLYSYKNATTLRLRTRLPENDPTIASVTSVWRAADWHEREAFDMFGIQFTGHPDLRRILMWDGYPYFPLRKDFPLAGKPSEMPGVAFTKTAPLAGGPFVAAPDGHSFEKEPRAKGES